MSDDQRSSSPFDGRGRPDLPGLGAEEIEAARLSEILAADERAEVPDLDPTEDPMLASLSATAASLRASLEASNARASFQTFHDRSRRHVMAATPQVALKLASEERGESLLQRWNGLFTSVSSAAAAAVATFVVTVLAIGGGSSTEPLASVQATDPPAAEAHVADASESTTPRDSSVNLTALSVDGQIDRYRTLLNQLNDLTNDGQPVDAGLLREIADTSATVARAIEEQPSAVSGATAWEAYHATFEAQKALSKASVASDDDQIALDTAQVVADGAFVTAARYLENPALAPTYEDVVVAAGFGQGAGTTPLPPPQEAP